MISSLGIISQSLLVGPIWEVRADAGLRPRILEMSLASGTGGSASMQFSPVLTPGVGPTKQYFTPEDHILVASRVWAATAWLTAPLNTTINGFIGAAGSFTGPYTRRSVQGIQYAQGVVWVFSKGLVIPPNGSWAVWTSGGISNVAINCTVEE